MAQGDGFAVICYISDVGQDEDFVAACVRTKRLGASDAQVEDIKRNLVNNFIFPAVKVKYIYENRYLFGTSLARP